MKILDSNLFGFLPSFFVPLTNKIIKLVIFKIVFSFEIFFIIKFLKNNLLIMAKKDRPRKKSQKEEVEAKPEEKAEKEQQNKSDQNIKENEKKERKKSRKSSKVSKKKSKAEFSEYSNSNL